MPEAVMDMLKQMNRVADCTRMTELEKAHDPVITCPDSVKANQPFECRVHVGAHAPHPNEPGHYIGFIDLYLDDLYLCRADLAARKSDPKVTFTIMLPTSGTLKAYESCNLHGVWESTKEMKVT